MSSSFLGDTGTSVLYNKLNMKQLKKQLNTQYIYKCMQNKKGLLTKPSVLWRCWLAGRKGIWPVKTEWWDAGMVVCLDRGADLHMAQLMPLPLTVSCFNKILIGFTFLVLAHLGSPGNRAVKRACVLTRVSKYTHTYIRVTSLCLGLSRWAGTRKVKPIWVLLKQETVSSSGISWATCKSAPCYRQITTPAPHHSAYYRPDALPAA